MGGYRGSEMVLLTVAMVVCAAVTVAGQASPAMGSCAEKLVGCASYLNATTTPPSTCCGPLKEAVTNEKTCLCNLYADPDLLKGFGVNITQALNLPTLCKLSTADPDPKNFCKGVSPSGSPSAGSVPAAPGGGSSSGTGSGSGSNTASTITGTGLISSAFMFVAYMLVC